MDEGKQEKPTEPDSMKTAKFLLEIAGYLVVFFIAFSAIPPLVGILIFDLFAGFNVITWVIVVPVLLFFVAAVIAAWKKMPVLRRRS